MAEKFLNLQSVEMKRAFEQQTIELEQQKKVTERAIEQACLANIEMLKQFGIILTDEQEQELIKHAVEQQECGKKYNIIGALQYNVLLELVQVTEQYALHDYPDIMKGVDAKLTDVLNQQFEEIKEEFEQQAKELEQQKRAAEQAAEKASLFNIEMLKQFGITLTDEQVEAILKHSVER